MRGPLLILVGLLSACGSSEEPCITFDSSCTPLYAPTFAQVHARTLVRSCAQAGGACHTKDGNAGGIAFEDIDAAYAALVSAGRVTPGDAACSTLSKRLESEDSAFQMPPGSRLSPETRCAIEQWIAAGAPR